MNYKVKVQKVSNGKTKVVYANIGDRIKEISRSGDTLIVEKKDGVRFSINVQDLEQLN